MSETDDTKRASELLGSLPTLHTRWDEAVAIVAAALRKERENTEQRVYTVAIAAVAMHQSGCEVGANEALGCLEQIEAELRELALNIPKGD